MIADPQLYNMGVKSPPAVSEEVATVLAAGVDYFSGSSADPARAELLQGIGWRIVYEEADAGHDLKEWHWKGYDGITSGSGTIGVRSDGTYIRLSGALAAERWKEAYRQTEHVARYDLAVTVRLPSGANPAKEAFHTADPRFNARRGRRIAKARHIETWDDGETTYLGGRTSLRMGRIYDKYAEQKREEYRNAWRWELEYKNELATHVAGAVSGSASESEAALAYVWDDFRAFGVPPIWGSGATTPALSLGRGPSSDQKRLEWLLKQVAPTVALLRAHGLEAEVYEALGLPLPV